MLPLNRVERNNAYLRFLLLFSITIGIVVIVTFSSIKTQFLENEQLQRRMLVLENEKNMSDSFRVAMNVTLNELAKFDSKTEPAITTKRRVQINIEKMGKLIKKMPEEMSKGDRSIYDLVLQNLADLSDAKTKIRNLEDQKVP